MFSSKQMNVVGEKHTTTNFNQAFLLSLFSLFSNYLKKTISLLSLSTHLQYPHFLYISSLSLWPWKNRSILSWTHSRQAFEPILHWNGSCQCHQCFYLAKSSGQLSVFILLKLAAFVPVGHALYLNLVASSQSLEEPETRTCMELVYLGRWFRKQERRELRWMNQERQDRQFKSMLLICLLL